MRDIDDPGFRALVEKGVSLARLQHRLRASSGATLDPDDPWRDFSSEGFLGRDEKLLEIVHDDWTTVESHGTTHTAIAAALLRMVPIRTLAGNFEPYDLASGYEFDPGVAIALGLQSCPWQSGDVASCAHALGGNRGVILRKGLSSCEVEEAKRFFGSGTADHVEAAARQLREPFYARVTSLLPHLIEEHRFFEGRLSPYRADPAFLIKALGL